MLLSLLKAEGHSMEPIIKNGSFLINSSIPYFFRNPEIDEIIVFRHREKIIVKKIVKIDKDKIFVEGINKLDSKKFDPIYKKNILGKVIWMH